MGQRYTLLIVLGLTVVVASASLFSFMMFRPSARPDAVQISDKPVQTVENVRSAPVLEDASTVTGKSVELGKDNLGPSPKDLEAITFVCADVSLEDWLNNWAKHHDHDSSPNGTELEALNDILARSPLSSSDLMMEAHSFNTKFGAPIVTTQIYHAAAVRLDRELAEVSDSPKMLCTVAAPFIKNRQNIKDVLWPLIDDTRDPIALDTLYTFYFDIVKINSPKPLDRQMRAVTQSVRIGLAECYYLKGQSDEALKLIHESDQGGLPAERRSALEWIWGIVMYHKGQYKEATQHLEAVSQDGTSPHRQEAMAMLVAALARTGKIDQADRAFDDWVREAHPTVEQAAGLLGVIKKAREG